VFDREKRQQISSNPGSCTKKAKVEFVKSDEQLGHVQTTQPHEVYSNPESLLLPTSMSVSDMQLESSGSGKQ
jgi:hypothetical protein